MLLLTSTSDKVQVITTTTANIDVHASWIDLASGVVSAGRTNTRISTATTTDVVAAPAASTARNVKTLHVANNHASASNIVTVQHTDGSNVIIIESVTLAAGERCGYVEGVGFRVFDPVGREKLQNAQTYPGNSNTADVVASAADTYLTGSSLAIPSIRQQVGSGFRWRFRATKTAAGVAAATFNIRTGTAGAVGDTSRCLFTASAIQTAVTDTGWFDLEANFRAIGSSAVLNGIIRMDHTSADAVGMGTIRYLQTLSSSFDSTPAGTIIGVSCNPGTAGVWTFQLVSVEAYGLLV